MSFGTIGEYQEGREEWKQYAERVDHYLAANGITDADRKRAVFLSVIGPKAYKLLASLVAPQKLVEVSYADLVKKMTDHQSPPPSEIVQRFKFHTRVRGPRESIATYVAELRALGQHCGFGDTLEDMLRDRLVCGVNDERIQRRLLAEREMRLDFKRALELAYSVETADKNSKELQSRTSAEHQPRSQKNVFQVTPSSGSQTPCYRCGRRNHKPASCKFKNSRCHNCGQVGHLKAKCPNEPKNKDKVKNIQDVEDSVEPSELLKQINTTVGRAKPIMVEVELNGHQLSMELDTGASVSLISAKTDQAIFKDMPLQESTAALTTYSGEQLEVLGQRQVEVVVEGQRATLPLIVVAGHGQSLFGRDWLRVIRLNWKSIGLVQRHSLEDLLKEFEDVFRPGLGTLKGYQAKIIVDPDAKPRFCRARTVPYALRKTVEEELERLQQEGIIEPVQFAEWAAPIVPVLKSGGKAVRICGDFKQTVNQASKLDRYPIPRIQDLFATLAGGKKFSKLDMSQAYQQIKLDKDSQAYVTINTHQGLFAYKRLPFGVASAPGIFQRVMECLLKGIPGVTVYLDDVLITGPTEAKHLTALREVLRRMSRAGLRLRRDKCTFLASSVVYLGHQIDAEGLHPVSEKVQAIQDAPTPRDVTELKAYLGLLTYYNRFLPNLATLLAPIYTLLRRDQPWKWTTAHEEAFVKSKELMLKSQLLVHFDPTQEIVLACDASAYGIGGVLSHRMPDGQERPVGFVSRTLNKAERNYSQIEKEGLACVFAVRRFHDYVYGHAFTLQTDHKPLLSLFNEKKGVPPQASGRIQRWALKLAAYQYTMSCRSTTSHANADALSRLPIPDSGEETAEIPELVLIVNNLQDAPITSRQIAHWSARDKVLSRVLRYIQDGWPQHCPDELKPYWLRRTELTSHEGCILWGGRVVVPEKGREYVVSELHGGHPGATRMKALARGLVWWPGLDGVLEGVVKNCPECQEIQSLPPTQPMQPWSWPTRPWSRLHLDFAGPLDGRMFLVIVDAHSKWLDVIPMKTASAQTTIQRLRTVFANFGVPESIVTDNGPQFTAAEFQEFCKSNGIRHILIAPYHPASNGLAERGVRTFKESYHKQTEGSIEDRLARFLLQYRITPHSTTGRSPAELLFGRKIRTRLDSIRPDLSKTVEQKQHQQKESHDRNAQDRSLAVRDKVFVKNFGPGKRWLPGILLRMSGPRSFMVKLWDGRVVRRHLDHLRKRAVTVVRTTEGANDVMGDLDVSQPALTPVITPLPAAASEPPPRRYPSRDRRAPQRYDPS